MKRSYILVEGSHDEAFLRKVLPAELLQDVGIIRARGGLPSLARTIIIERSVPVAIFMDADSIVPKVVEERRQSIEELVRAVGPGKVILVAPELETFFFEVPEVVERIMNAQLTPDQVYLGKRDPRGVLTTLSSQTQKWNTIDAIEALTPDEIARLRETAPIADLMEFVQRSVHAA